MQTKPLTKVTGRNKFELIHKVRQKEKQGWKRGKIRHEVERFKYFDKRGKWKEYKGDQHSMMWTCYMTREW